MSLLVTLWSFLTGRAREDCVMCDQYENSRTSTLKTEFTVLPFLLNVVIYWLHFTDSNSLNSLMSSCIWRNQCSTNALTAACVRPVLDINDTSVQRKWAVSKILKVQSKLWCLKCLKANTYILLYEFPCIQGSSRTHNDISFLYMYFLGGGLGGGGQRVDFLL